MSSKDPQERDDRVPVREQFHGDRLDDREERRPTFEPQFDGDHQGADE